MYMYMLYTVGGIHVHVHVQQSWNMPGGIQFMHVHVHVHVLVNGVLNPLHWFSRLGIRASDV